MSELSRRSMALLGGLAVLAGGALAVAPAAFAQTSPGAAANVQFQDVTPRGQTYVQANPRGSDAPAVAAPDPQTAGSPVAPSMPEDPNYHGGPYVGALSAPPAAAMNKAYPLCSTGLQDECRNSTGR